MSTASHGEEDFLSHCLHVVGMGKGGKVLALKKPARPSSQVLLGRSILEPPALQTRAASEASLSQFQKRGARIRWNMGPCQHGTWLTALRKTGLEADFCNLMQWRGFQLGSRRVTIKMKDFCHDKYDLARELLQYPSLSGCMPETYLSVEEFVAAGRNVEGHESLWFLKLSDVDYGCGVRPFHGPKTAEELRDLLEIAFLEATQSVTALRRAKGCKPRPVGRQIVIQRSIDSPLADGHKEDFRVYVCCTASSPRKVFVYQKIGVRKAPKAMSPGQGLSQATHCTHYGRITPAASSTDYRHYDVVFPRLCETVADIMQHFSPSLEEGSTVLLGMDFICDKSLKPWLLEINQVPRLCYEDLHVQAWTEGMAVDFLRLVVLPELGQNGQNQKPHQTLWTPV